MLGNGFKMEVESLITKDISYVTEEYVPERLGQKDFRLRSWVSPAADPRPAS